MKKLVFLLMFIPFVSQSQTTYTDSIKESRINKQKHLSNPEDGILNKEDLKEFKNVEFFDIDSNYRVDAKWIKDKGRKFKMPTSTDREPIYRRFGFITFNIENIEYQLTVYQNMGLKGKKEFKNYFFIPFRDETSGISTYGGGRYLDTHIAKKQNIVCIDFNKSYNPYCAYSHRYSCPIPPTENTLEVEINAGEKTPVYHSEH